MIKREYKETGQVLYGDGVKGENESSWIRSREKLALRGEGKDQKD